MFCKRRIEEGDRGSREIAKSCDDNHEERWSFGLRCYLIAKDEGMGLRAPFEMGKVTQEQERVKPRKTLPSSCSQGSVGSRDYDFTLAGLGAPPWLL